MFLNNKKISSDGYDQGALTIKTVARQAGLADFAVQTFESRNILSSGYPK